ncbi:MAG: DUF484 family protein [Boseongicola sp.]|nr:DUF484 family protein [Boseongicola sp.]MDD9977401.1 DUF484 family protein [Boseongicola sp.]
MNDAAELAEDLRTRILKEPDVILSDPDVMRALIAANERAMGGNIVDLRGVAMERLEDRLNRLEDTHKSVIAAAYENLAGTNQIHRAILAFLEPLDFESFLRCLSHDVADILRVGRAKLVLESHDTTMDPSLAGVSDVLSIAAPGFCEDYVGRGRAARQVTLRSINPGEGTIYGNAQEWVQSEACILLDFGENRLPGMLAFGSDDPQQFSPNQGTDLLSFFGGVFERAMRRWLG